MSIEITNNNNDNNTNKKYISYSQYSILKKCPYSWYKQYIEKIKLRTQSSDTLFGTILHETLQHFLTILYTVTKKEATNIDMLKGYYSDRIVENYEKLSLEEQQVITIEKFINTYYESGVEIIKEFIKKWFDYFPGVRDYELIGTEIDLESPIFDNQNLINMTGKIDIVVKNKLTNIYTIIDLKTSYKGWNDTDKKDETKHMQLFLYKHYYSKVFNVDANNIEVMFIVLKKNVFQNPNLDFTISRIQRIEIPSKRKLKVAINEFVTTISNYVNKDTYTLLNEDIHYNKVYDKDICKKCVFYETEHCDSKNKIKRKPKE